MNESRLRTLLVMILIAGDISASEILPYLD